MLCAGCGDEGEGVGVDSYAVATDYLIHQSYSKLRVAMLQSPQASVYDQGSFYD
jgi:hypothetical protein